METRVETPLHQHCHPDASRDPVLGADEKFGTLSAQWISRKEVEVPEIIGIDHIYIAVTDMERSMRFYDVVMKVLGFKKNVFSLGPDPHIQYFNRHFGYVLRPARSKTAHDSYSPGLHHFCFRVDTEADVHELARALREQGVSVSDPKRYPEYADDYVACFFDDPDGIRLEVTNYRRERRERHDHWDTL